VAEPKPESEEVSKPVPQEQTAPSEINVKESIAVSAPLKNLLEAITPEKAKIAEQMGLPLNDMITWMVHREQFEGKVLEAFQELGKNIKPAMELAAKVQQIQNQQPNAPAPGSTTGSLGGLGGIFQMIAPFLGQTSSNPMAEKFMEALMNKAIEDITKKGVFEDTFREYMTKKMANELASMGVPK